MESRLAMSSDRAQVAAGVFGALLLAAAPAARAQEAAPDGVKDWSLYARFGVGASFVNRLDQDLVYDSRLAFIAPPPDRRVSDFDAAASPSVAIGFSYPSGARTELEYRFLRPPFDSVREFGGFDFMTGGFGAVDVTPAENFAAHFLMSNAYYEVARAGRAGFFIGAGVGGGFFNNGLGARDAAFAYQGRGGVSVDITEKASVSMEYVYLRTRDVVFGPDRLGEGDLGVQALGEPFVMSTANASLQLKF